MGYLKRALIWFCEFMAEYHESEANEIFMECMTMNTESCSPELAANYRLHREDHLRMSAIWFDRAERIEFGD
jgi:hypothetical protein